VLLNALLSERREGTLAMDADTLVGGEWDVFLGMDWQSLVNELRRDCIVEGMTAHGEGA
jgi:hypothetical protein